MYKQNRKCNSVCTIPFDRIRGFSEDEMTVIEKIQTYNPSMSIIFTICCADVISLVFDYNQ